MKKIKIDFLRTSPRSHSERTKTSPQATMGKANQNFVQFWCEAEQTGPARVSYLLRKKRRKTPWVSSQRELKLNQAF